jgi:phosphoserine phosphatase RsbU/P
MSETPQDSVIKVPLPWLRHELRTPINQIIGYSEMIQEDAEDSGNSSFSSDLQKIQQAARHMLAIINEHLVPVPEGNQSLVMRKSEMIKRKDAAGEPAPQARRQKYLEPDHGSILLVDDNESNRDMLSRQLERQGYSISLAENGQQALESLRTGQFDLILLDIIMPGMDGYEVLEYLKSDKDLRHIPVIMISALDEMESVIRCIEIGAEDYLPKPFDPVLLRARIGASLEKKRLRDQEQMYMQALVETQERLNKELQEAADYVKSILPEPLSGPIETHWCFIPSTQLGGDAFGYHWIDDDHFGMYLLDVCGHGVGAALLSISVMNVLRSQSLPGTDFKDPAQVLKALNESFQMERQNDQYFTIWYGVYEKKEQRIIYAGGGHPPAVAVIGPLTKGGEFQKLKGSGPPVGWDIDSHYGNKYFDLVPDTRLFIFSDGTYEIAREDGSMLDMNEFIGFLAQPADGELTDIERIVKFSRAVRGSDTFEDDFSLVEIVFP